MGRKIVGDVPPIEVQRAPPLLTPIGREKGTLPQQKESPDPRETSQRNFQAARPIYADGIRVFFLPVRPLCQNLAREAVISCKPVGLGKRDEMLMAV